MGQLRVVFWSLLTFFLIVACDFLSSENSSSLEYVKKENTK